MNKSLVSSPVKAKEMNTTIKGEETNESKMIRLYESGATFEAYPAVPGSPRCGMRAQLRRCLRRPRRGAQWPRVDCFRSFKRRFPTRRVAPPFCRSGVGRRVLFVPAVASNAGGAEEPGVH